MAENYGTLEGTLDEHGVLSGEMSDRATLEGEIQFGSGGGGVLDVFQNGQSVVQGRYAYVTVPTFLKDLRSDDYHNTVTTLEIQKWNGKADPSDIPTALSQLDNDDNYVQDVDYVHTDNNFTDDDKAAIGGIPENITDLSDVAVDNIQNGQVLKWDATQNKFVNANESGGGSGDVTDVKVNNASVVDAQGVANIDLTGYAEKSDLGTASSKDVPATGNAGANEVVLGNDTRLSDSRPASDVSSWAKADSKPTYQYSEIQNTPSLGTAAAKDFDNSVIDGSSNLVTGDAVHDAIDNAVSGAYKHAGTKTCAELISSLLVKANAGNVYNMTDSGTTTSDFIEGAGLPIRAGDNVGVAKIDENTYKFDLLSGFIDTSNFITKSSTSGLVKNDGSIDTTSYQPTESGKGLSTNDYDNTAKGKVDALGTASTKNVPTSGDAGNNEVVLGNDTRLTDARPASDVSAWAKESTKPSYTKSEVGLGNVDNTSDSTKKTNFTGSIASGDTGFTTGGDVYTALGGKADKVSGATNGNLAGLNSSGNLTDSGWNGAKDTTSISGNPISISGLKSNQLAKNPIITFEPIQDLHGQSKPYPAGGGKNKLNLTIEALKQNNTGGTWSGNTYSFRGIVYTVLTDNAGNVIGINANGTNNTGNHSFFYAYANLPAGSYKVAGCPSGGSSSTWIIYTSAGVNDYGSGATFTLSSASLIETRCWVYNGATISNKIFYPMIYDANIGDATFAPYENICPISGYDKIEVLSCGKNLFDGAYSATGVFLRADGSEYAGTYNISQYISVKANAAYYFSNLSGTTSACICWYNKAKEFISSQSITEGFTATSPVNACYVRASIRNDKTNVCINEGNTAITYVPYVKTTSISESLGQTVYGLTHEVRTGKARVTCKAVDMGTLNYIYNPALAAEGIFPFDISDMSPNAQILVCSGYEAIINNSGWTIQNNQVIHPNTFQTCRVKNTNCTTVEQIKAANSGIILVYELATYGEIQLTPHEISLLKDYAYVSTNGTSIALDYHNGELASLSDVAQVGETLNELEDKVSANDAGTQVNLMTYNTSTNKYVCPSDGYISLSNAGASVGDYIIMSVYGANDNTICGLRCDTPVASMITTQSLFVKRGMKCYVRATSSTGSFAALFTPLA